MPTEFVNHPDIKLFETKEKARIWLQKFREAENSLGTLSTPQEGVNPMTKAETGQTVDANGNPIDMSVAYDEKGFPIVAIYQAEEDVMPIDNKPEAA